MKSESKLYELKVEWSANLNEHMVYLYCNHNINGVVTSKILTGKLQSYFKSDEELDKWFEDQVEKDQIDRTPRTIKTKQIIISTQTELDL